MQYNIFFQRQVIVALSCFDTSNIKQKLSELKQEKYLDINSHGEIIVYLNSIAPFSNHGAHSFYVRGESNALELSNKFP